MNEQTLIQSSCFQSYQWLHFAVLLGTISTALLNFIDFDDTVGLISAACYTATALMAVVYSGGIYAYRLIKLKNREAIEYHDSYGPTALCLAMISSVAVNLILRLVY